MTNSGANSGNRSGPSSEHGSGGGGMDELDAYDYTLPEELIAQFPCSQRTDARLMVVDRARQAIRHAHIRDLPEFLRAGDLLVLNDTKVLPARLDGYRVATRGRWSGLFLSADAQGTWKIMSKTRGRLQAGESVMLCDRELQDVCRMTMLAPLEEGLWAARPEIPTSALELLDQVGRVPLPPYIRDGAMSDSDRDRYQTVYAQNPGAVAAPTAGLHFTTDLLRRLAEQGVESAQVTLHVGIGTFRPVSVTRLADHVMHSEWGRLSAASAERLRACRQQGGRIVAVGTTSIRVLETAAAGGHFEAWQGDTNLFIRPPYTFQGTDALMTNFHLPRSTLLVLVRAFGGDALLRRAYEEAVEQRYRFFSYGDAMLIV